MRVSVPKPAALVVIDVQRGLFEADPPPADAPAVLQAIATTIRNARAAGCPVIFVRHNGTAEEGVAPHTAGWELHPALPVAAGDLVLEKNTCDAFHGTGLAEALQDRGIRALALAGYATDFCVDSTLRAAVSRELQVFIVADGHTTHDNPVLGANQVRAHHNWAWANAAGPLPVQVVPAGQLHFDTGE